VIEDYSSIPSIFLGAVIGAAALMPTLLKFRARAKDISVENIRIESLSNRTRGILAASPDGLFLWDHDTGGITCSRRLADLLALENGTLARYENIRTCFVDADLQRLEQNVSLLRAKGTAFNIILMRGTQRIQALGARAENNDGKPVADIVWMRDVTRLAQTAVSEPRNTSGADDKHLTALLDTLPIPLWLRDAKLNLAFQNRAAERIEGLNIALAEQARQSGAPITATGEITENATARQVNLTEAPLAPGSGVNGGTIGFAVDIEEASTSTPVAAATGIASPIDILRPLDIGVAVFDGDTTLVAANAAFAELWRIDHDWLETRPAMSDLLTRLRELRRLPEVADFSEFRRHELGRFGGLDRIDEDELYLPDGRTIRRRFGALDGDGLVMTCEDLSGNLEIRRSLKSLDQVQRTTLENLREGIAVFGSDGRLQLTNPQMLSLWDFTPEDLPDDMRLSDVVAALGMRLAANDEPWAARKERIASEILAQRISTGKVDLINNRILAFANIPLPDGATLVSYGDITDASRVETALRERARTLAEADRMKTEFITNVAIEVRTPLNTIHGFADILYQEMFGELNRRQQEYAQGIVSTSEKMMGVVGDILDLATIEAGRMELNKDTVDPHAIMVDAFNVVKEQAKKKNIRIDFDCPPDIGWITADAKRLTQVVLNLLTNAVTFTPKLGHVTLTGSRKDEWIEISVSDSGPGIPKAERQRMMEPFGRLKDEEHKGDGPGLGLTIVKRFAELHGGGVDIRSNKSRGANVIVRIPVDGENKAGVAPFDGEYANLEERAAK
jgi:signal transduction histidine kinase